MTTLPSINGSPAGTVVNVAGTVSPVPPIGTVFFLYRRVRYEFKASTILPGRTGLWRTLVTTGATEELATPFATTARVNFYVVSSSTAAGGRPDRCPRSAASSSCSTARASTRRAAAARRSRPS